MSAHHVFDRLLDMGVIADYVSIDEWKSRLVKKAQDENDYILNFIAQSLGDLELYLKNKSIYDCSRFERALSANDLQQPVIDSEYFMKMLRPSDG
ncbi:MAG: hypothetical protein JSV38_09015 [Desulfobacterales bacterium]|nr:MAG: hypothetical protein JSV38_09015 [Desulfobacterales bacterium]